MRLLNTQTFYLHQFFGFEVPPYASVSHMWGDEELSFQDWLYVQNQDPARWGLEKIEEEMNLLKSKNGYLKAMRACQQAQQDGYDWIWMDTMCIEKTSSAELSEAVDSMFKWYANSSVCYAYLGDVPNLDQDECHVQDSLFRKSRWFTRGWTLQELIAPSKLEFYSANWTVIGSKYDLVNLLNEITRVPRECLVNSNCVNLCSIAAKMSWASRRETSRDEDLAYCLMGIFNVHMPLIYGEGLENAYLRLQEEIIKESSDQSLFVWRRQRQPTPAESVTWGILATHPSDFKDTASVLRRGRPGTSTFQ